MTHDYKAALNRFDKHLTQSDPDANGKTLTRHGGAFFTDSEIVAIRKSLKIADKLMQEPSNGMALAVCDIYERTDTEAKVMAEQAKYDFKAMRDQMLKEIDNDDQTDTRA